MSLEERLAAAAKAAREKKVAEIERLLAENAGRLLRASELREKPSEARKPRSLLELLPGSERIECADGAFVRTVASVGVSSDTPMHERGYAFLPAPTLPVPSTERLSEIVRFLSGDEMVRGIALEKYGFLDLETTGLTGASGTYPILVGLGYFRRRDAAGDGADPRGLEFVCEQYFMEDYCHEPPMLEHLAQRLRAFEGLVTFNGKSFDVPLLRGRYVMNRMRVDLELPHVDLLHACRRVYRPRIGECSLGAIERQVLGVAREHDVDGSLVPRLYFDFLRGVHPERIVPVFDHNVQDVISMGALLLLFVEFLDSPDHPAIAHAHDMAAVGRLHKLRGSRELATEFLERAALHSRDNDLTNRSLRDLARIYAGAGRFAEAAELWERELARTGVANSLALVELLKLCEHRLRDFERAIALIVEAEAHYAERDGCEIIRQDIARRRERIERRARNKRGKANAV